MGFVFRMDKILHDLNSTVLQPLVRTWESFCYSILRSCMILYQHGMYRESDMITSTYPLWSLLVVPAGLTPNPFTTNPKP